MTFLDAVELVLIIASPTLLGAAVLCAPRLYRLAADYVESLRPPPLRPLGPPIEKLAADLRRLLRLHGDLTDSAHLGMRAHRLWSIETAIGMRAIEAARALDIEHPEAPQWGLLPRGELLDLLNALSAAGLVLPAKVGPFTSDGRL